ncbi:Uncharacterised protein [Mycobacteroides abscessus subsp. abscessus]|nr:Uncharacterised protein [Mycobacteroides abscessus subsp. abscessus]
MVITLKILCNVSDFFISFLDKTFFCFNISGIGRTHNDSFVLCIDIIYLCRQGTVSRPMFLNFSI